MWGAFLPVIHDLLNALLLGFGGLLVAFLVTKFSHYLLSRWMSPVWSRFVSSLLGLGMVVWTAKIVLDSTGAEGLALIIITAVTGAFALGSSMVTEDLVAGIGLFFSMPYEVGDMVSLAGHDGKVSNVALFLTTLESERGDRIYIRNSEVTKNSIINYAASENPDEAGQLITIKVPLPVTQDLNMAIAAIEKDIQNFNPELSTTQFKPSVRVETASSGYFDIEVNAYATESPDFSSQKTRLFTMATNAVLNAGLKL
jgi:small-conductance mechanosensitive channel